MRSITQVYESIRNRGASLESDYEKSSDHKEKMLNSAIEMAKIGQKIKLGRCGEQDGDRLITIAREIEKEYK